MDFLFTLVRILEIIPGWDQGFYVLLIWVLDRLIGFLEGNVSGGKN